MLNRLPFVSVIMPVRNEAEYVARSLGAVLAQDYPHERMEVLIVDGMSTDSTKDMVTRTIADNPDIRLSILDNPQRTMPAGFNKALSVAAGDIVFMLGGHCQIAPDYVSQGVNALQSSDAQCVGGVIRTISQTPVGESIALALSSPFGVGGVSFRTATGNVFRYVDTVAFGAYWSSVFKEIGDLDSELVRNQDDEFNYRLRKNGGRILLTSAIRVDYYSRSTLRSLWRQYFQYGLYKVRVMRKHPQQMQLRQFVPPVFVLSVVFGGLLSTVSLAIRRLWLTALGVHAVANVVFSLRLASIHGWPHLSRLPIIFAILHLSYGLGFLVGLMKLATAGHEGRRERRH